IYYFYRSIMMPVNQNGGGFMPENNTRKPDKSATVHIDAGTMEKIERYQQFIKDNHPGMPVPTKGQITRSAVEYWYRATLGAWL
ncbi:hypothetical protein, partial [Escherichia coli]